MNFGFWKNLKKPFFALAPMADVTDAAFRQIIAKYGKPDVMWTEFVSADGLVLAPKQGKEKLLLNLKYSKAERPIVAQIFSARSENIAKAVKIVHKLGFDGVDLNMGCPDRAVVAQGAGASLMKNPKLARELIKAAKKAAGTMPVSVKTRVGYNKVELDTWLPEILAEEPAVVTVHARTRKEMSLVPARWELVKRAVEIRNKLGSRTLIIGNGDVRDIADADAKARETGADGIMLGRAVFGNPWLFSQKAPEHRPAGHASSPTGDAALLGADRACASSRRTDVQSPSVRKKLEVLLEHAALFEKMFGGARSFAIMKKHFKAYVAGFDGAANLRAKLMESANAREVSKLVHEFLAGAGSNFDRRKVSVV